MRRVFASLISIYQRYVSPRKGYSCAHRCLHGGYSCSEAVKQLVLSKGLLFGLSEIRVRFRDCRTAALELRARASASQRSDLDCGLSGCVGCDGCGDMGVVDYCSGGTEGIKAPSLNITVPTIQISVGALLILLISSYWFYGRQVSSIDIRLIDASQEVRDRQLTKIFDGVLPDYQIILTVAGREVKTDRLANVSAKDWIRLELDETVFQSKIDQFKIVNKQILSADTLEVFDDPDRSGKGEFFEYKTRKRWQLF